MSLLGKTALVCGGTQGIGYASAQGLAQAGASVVLLARDRDRLAAARGNLPIVATGQEHDTIMADLDDPVSTRRAVESWIDRVGPIQILVNNTGGPPGGPIVAATAEAFVTAFRQHLLGNHLLAQAVIPGMRASGYGRIINIVSTSVRQPIKGLGVSNTTRGAVASWAKTLAGELGPDGITVNNVLPGATKTGRLEAIIDHRAKAAGATREEIERDFLTEIPLGRFGTPDEIAAAVVFLASPAAGYITGVSLPVDGGRIECL
jgi:3-oxoacyl-[acyl-carrier protein] reductase